MKLLIISHTEHYIKDNIVVGWGPTVNEINKLSTLFEKVYHIAPLHTKDAPNSSISYNENIEFISIQPSGGMGLQKLSILSTSFNTINIIKKYLKECDIVHFRAPTGIGIFVLPYLKLFNRKKLWVKYAGNWKDHYMPMGNRLQKWWLRTFISESDTVTVNGIWKGEKENLISFQNPTLDIEDREKGKIIINQKKIDDKLNFCFVGALNDHKGVNLIIEAFSNIENQKIGEIHFIGNGNDEKKYIDLCKINNLQNVFFHGFLKKNDIISFYQKCHFLLLPSKSEGFPKVVGEAMNYGCIPIVSDVSSIGQIIVDDENGFLISKLNTNDLTLQINKALNIENEKFKNIVVKNFILAEKFTFDIYLKNVKLILEIHE
jgi:glycosyltransferase involved in cell wall biosynthesis